MTDFIKELRNIASNSTVQATAGLLAIGGFLANAVFGFGQSAVSLGIQGIGAAITLGVVAAKACTNDNADNNPSTYIPTLPRRDKPSKPYYQVNQNIYRSPSNITSCGATSVEPSLPTPTILDNIISCGPSFIPSLVTRAKRRNADDDMRDMAYGTETRAGWKPWAS